MAKVRADQLLVEAGLAESRSRARAMIMAGQVLADGRRVDKAGELLPEGIGLSLKDQGGRYVSRGGEKLAGALEDLGFSPAGMRALDVGASTGGFTDCLLQHGAASVTAVDVGYGQFHWRLRQDPRVTLFERTNARHLDGDQVGRGFDLAVIDVSFISLSLILPPVAALLAPTGRILALVKPQFEVGREKVGKGGVVRDPALREETVEKVAEAARSLGMEVLGAVPARIRGPKGNQEFLMLLAVGPGGLVVPEPPQ